MDSGPNHGRLWLDLRPYLNPAALFVTGEAPLPRCHALFRNLGIRHLPVVNNNHEVSGILTRKDVM